MRSLINAELDVIKHANNIVLTTLPMYNKNNEKIIAYCTVGSRVDMTKITKPKKIVIFNKFSQF